MRIAFGLAMALLLVGCEEQGKPIKHTSYEQTRQQALDEVRKAAKPVIEHGFVDPDALKIDKEHVFSDDIHGKSLCLYANARNRSGGYNGFRWYLAVPKSGKLYDGAVAESKCAN